MFTFPNIAVGLGASVGGAVFFVLMIGYVLWKHFRRVPARMSLAKDPSQMAASADSRFPGVPGAKCSRCGLPVASVVSCDVVDSILCPVMELRRIQTLGQTLRASAERQILAQADKSINDGGLA